MISFRKIGTRKWITGRVTRIFDNIYKTHITIDRSLTFWCICTPTSTQTAYEKKLACHKLDLFES